MKYELWYLVMGGLLVLIALISSVVKRLPLTTTMLYLGVGIVLGPMGAEVANIDPLHHAAWLERLAELGVLVSLFTTGLKLRVPLDRRWNAPVRLALLSMILTVGMVTIAGVWWLGLPLGAAILLGAIVAPTDPVLASEVQLESPTDQDKLRFNLTTEAGFNDGTAFPFVMLGMGLLGLRSLGPGGSHWILKDVLWAACGGFVLGALLGVLIGQVVLYLRRHYKESFGLDEFLALGLIGLSYGSAALWETNGFLAVLGSGVALRMVERWHTGAENTEIVSIAPPHKKQEIATHPEKAPAYLAEAVLEFNEQVERILEVALVLLVGAMLAPQWLHLRHLLFLPLLLLVIRPLSVYLGLVGCKVDEGQRVMISWFGIRGIGSLYYLVFVIRRNVPEEISRELISLVLWVIATSVIIHGVSVTALMRWYRAKFGHEESHPGKLPLSAAGK
jgi:NhaP-type Na+/H+ or K+/H+ antiporter